MTEESNLVLYKSKYTGQEIDSLLDGAKGFLKQLQAVVERLNTAENRQTKLQTDIGDLGTRVDDADKGLRSDIDTLFGKLPDSIIATSLTQDEYDHMKAQGQLTTQWYLIFPDYTHRQLQRIYYYGTLVAQRGKASGSSGFPYTFPIIFS